MTPETIHSKLDGVVSGVTSAGSFFNDDSGKSTEQQNRTFYVLHVGTQNKLYNTDCKVKLVWVLLHSNHTVRIV